MKKRKHKSSSGKSKTVRFSSVEIEKLYKIEKKKIENSTLRLEEERLKAYLRMMDKRKALLKEKLDRLKKIENFLSRQTDEAMKRVSDLKGVKLKEKKHFDLLYLLNEQLKDIENQAKKVMIARKEMLDNEKRLFRTARESLNKNKKELKLQDASGVREINDVLNKKMSILEDTAGLLSKDSANLFKDKKVLEKITDAQLKKLSDINLKLKKATKQQDVLIKKLQKLKADNFGYKQAFNELNYKRQKIFSDLKDLKNKFVGKNKTRKKSRKKHVKRKK